MALFDRYRRVGDDQPTPFGTYAAVRPTPYIPGPYGHTMHLPPDDLPPDVVPAPVRGGCDGCPAEARVALARVVVDIPAGWTRHYAASVPDDLLRLCSHHADRSAVLLDEEGWVVVARWTERGTFVPAALL